MMKSDQDAHDKEFDSKHTKMMLRSLTRELSESKVSTKQQLEEIKEKLKEIKQELTTTKGKLADAEDWKKEQKNVIERLISLEENRMHDTPKEMFERLGEEQQDIDPKLLEPFSYEGKEYHFRNEFLRFIKLDYEGRMKMLLSKMEIGKLYYIEDGRRVIFKLQLVEQRNLYVEQCAPSSYDSYKTSKYYGNPCDWIFGNTYFAVFYQPDNSQYLAFNIESFNDTNSNMFLHSVRKNDQRYLLIYFGRNDYIDWNEYKLEDKFAWISSL